MTTAAALESIEIEALVTDRYLEALLAAAERRAPDAPADPSLDPALRGAALRLRDELVRVHPSFRFEERLARRLAEAAAGMRLAVAAGGEGAILPFPGATGDPLEGDSLDGDPLGAHPLGRTGPNAVRTLPRLPLLVGGAVTSAALSLAGAAFVAWRLTRGAPTDPMARAVRLARAARSAREGSPVELH
ncbi:MAG: hypothetical protein ABIG85_06675 [Chloroflexota bacterium]